MCAANLEDGVRNGAGNEQDREEGGDVVLHVWK